MNDKRDIIRSCYEMSKIYLTEEHLLLDHLDGKYKINFICDENRYKKYASK